MPTVDGVKFLEETIVIASYFNKDKILVSGDFEEAQGNGGDNAAV
jgi:hypothetical protein